MIIRILLLLSFCASLFAYNQEKKYPSLMWEISGNGLEKTSYLYGTMHVSNKVAFHLSDKFFEALESVDQVALEQDPGKWLEEYKEEQGYVISDYYSFFSRYRKFYSTFSREAIESKDIRKAFFSEYNIINGILYRSNDYSDDYQEETYLDMFIYQVGQKLNKNFYGLENHEEAQRLVNKAMKESYKNPEPRKAWLNKLLDDKSPYELLQDAYRNKDLDLIDSLNKGMDSEAYRKYMLDIRNENMVTAMDSLMEKGSLFAAVGAAHLPGEHGVIELLRKEGYTVTPVLGPYTQKGKSTKEKLENMIKKPFLKVDDSQDGIFSIPTFNKFYNAEVDDKKIHLSLDLPNGAYLVATRIKNLDFLRKDDFKISLSSVDSLLFENIPGKIVTKNELSLSNGYKGFDIHNTTKENDHQRYYIIVSPIETLVFNLVGKKEYERQVSKDIFDQLQLKEIQGGWSEFTPLQGGFSVNMPNYRVNYENKQDDRMIEAPEVYAYDPDTDSYYFIISNILDDYNEESAKYDLERIVFEFYNELEIDTLKTTYSETPFKKVQSKTDLGEKKSLEIMSTINNNHYYLLGKVSPKDTKTQDDFFTSYTPKNFNKYRKWEEYIDSTSLYKLKVPIKPAKQNNVYSRYNDNDDIEEKEVKDSITLLYKDETSFLVSGNGEALKINYEKNPKYRNYTSDEAFIKGFIYNDGEWKVPCDRIVDTLGMGEYKDGYRYYDFAFSDTLSDQRARYRYFHKDNKIYSLHIVENKVKPIQNEFFEYAFENIEFFTDSIDLITLPLEKKYGLPKKEDKNDKYSYVENDRFWSVDNEKIEEEVSQLRTIKDDEKKLKEYIAKNTFIKDKRELLFKAITCITRIKKPNIDYWTKLYKDNTLDADLQSAVLESMIYTDSIQGRDRAFELLKNDFPAVSSNQLEDVIADTWPIKGSVEKINEVLLPKFYVSSYRSKLTHYLNVLAEKKLLKSKNIKPFKDFMIEQAQYEIKKFATEQKEKEIEGNSYRYNSTDKSDVSEYIKLFHRAGMKKDLNNLIKSIRTYKNYDLLAILVEEEIPQDFTKAEYDSLSKNPGIRDDLFIRYKKQFGNKYHNEDLELSDKDVRNILQKKQRNFKVDRDSILLKDVKDYTFGKYQYKAFYYEVFYKEDENDYDYYNSNYDQSAAYIVFNVTDKEVLKAEKEAKKKCRRMDEKEKESENEYPRSSYGYNYSYDYSYNDDDDEEEVPEYITEYNSPYPIIIDKVNISIVNEDDWDELFKNMEDYLQNREHPRASFKLKNSGDRYTDYIDY